MGTIMLCLDLTLKEPAANLACDQALLDWCDQEPGRQILRFWEPSRYFVVLGFGNRLAEEINQDACKAEGVPILRRCSGGGTVLQGPGCLNYSLILQKDFRSELATVGSTNRFLMDFHRQCLSAALDLPIQVQGHTDLTLHQRKFSGNAQRRRQRSLLFHGTLLLDFDLTRIERCLRSPPRAPEYRAHRGHLDFLTCLPIPPDTVKRVFRDAWNADETLRVWPEAETARLAADPYSRRDWIERL